MQRTFQTANAMLQLSLVLTVARKDDVDILATSQVWGPGCRIQKQRVHRGTRSG
eukprot:CAMPEP_0172687708 /NCGR_PEP_ID=MMETSP1074-20121228/21887_1 /TAXON_ID=2916 /ORGANISM="Ceratium fusus, Strain PA161109" /LENGTH=53 /DNA_ID=CAMNT_0013507217 /DNA_START=69 /DNA_END=226 /DNA_ORIENTATION=-